MAVGYSFSPFMTSMLNDETSGQFMERYIYPHMCPAFQSALLQTQFRPLNDRVLIRRLDEPERIGSIIVPDIAKQRAIKGEIVAVGPGKWIPGEWWRVKKLVGGWPLYEWEWIEGYREVPTVYPGQTVYFNSRWNDIGDNQETPGPLWNDSLHLVQIADIYAISN